MKKNILLLCFIALTGTAISGTNQEGIFIPTRIPKIPCKLSFNWVPRDVAFRFLALGGAYYGLGLLKNGINQAYSKTDLSPEEKYSELKKAGWGATLTAASILLIYFSNKL